jgi:sec-independent protein translocase protein TatC
MEDTNNQEQEETSGEMTLVEHLEELRWMLGRSLLGLVLAAIACLSYSERLLSEILLAGKTAGLDFVIISPTEGFFSQLKVGLCGGLVLSFPWILYQLWKFVSPGLKLKEKKFFFYFLPVMIFLFLLGVSLAWFIALPLGLKFLLSFQIAEIKAQISVEKYLSFFLSMILVMGTLFELPVFLMVLSGTGLVKKESLYYYRKHVYLGVFALSAFLTPPDVVTQVLIAIPMVILYELTLLFMRTGIMGKEDVE